MGFDHIKRKHGNSLFQSSRGPMNSKPSAHNTITIAIRPSLVRGYTRFRWMGKQSGFRTSHQPSRADRHVIPQASLRQRSLISKRYSHSTSSILHINLDGPAAR
ncbi:hypothetical protein FRB94_009597 [Tulasnella sp. JGI-2019a]|nr:hypothetical protein FRB94_009597 [Tulasnella sp. JGI-2019a]KAG9025115.1 hypothetical protein FRB95_010567 [Tulasnella sp. JGI-2019a]